MDPFHLDIHGSLEPHDSVPKLHLNWFSWFCTVYPCDQHTDRRTNHTTCDICSNRPYPMHSLIIIQQKNHSMALCPGQPGRAGTRKFAVADRNRYVGWPWDCQGRGRKQNRRTKTQSRPASYTVKDSLPASAAASGSINISSDLVRLTEATLTTQQLSTPPP